MIKTKHFLDPIEPDDGPRLWVESIGLTRDLKAWCEVDYILPQLGPPKDLADWFAHHPEGYDTFRSRYHSWLAEGPYPSALKQLASESLSANLTLLHGADHPDYNAATALGEFIASLETHCPPDAPSSE